MQIERARDKKKLTEKETRELIHAYMNQIDDSSDTPYPLETTNTLRHTTQTFETALKWKRESRNNH
jgi:hypothetical protein